MFNVILPILKSTCCRLFPLAGLLLSQATCPGQAASGLTATYNSDGKITSISHHQPAKLLVDSLSRFSGSLDACSTITLGQHEVTGDEISAITSNPTLKLKTLIIGGPGEEVPISCAGVKSLAGLVFLEELFVFAEVEDKSDWSSLRMNKSLRRLTISGELKLAQSDLNVIGQFQHLQHLELRGCIETNVSTWLEKLKALERLDIESKSLDSGMYECVTKLSELKQLRIAGCPVGAVSLQLIVSALGKQLEQLDIVLDQQVSTLSLRELKSLRHLSITVPENASVDLSFLRGLELLKSLTVRGMVVPEDGVSSDHFKSSNIDSVVVTDQSGTKIRFMYSKPSN